MKSKMYECQAFFSSGFPKKWKYVRDLKSFAEFLSKDHSSWKYFNVYDKANKQFLKRFYPGNSIPKLLAVLFVALLTLKFTFIQTSRSFISQRIPTKHTFNKTTIKTFNKNGFINSATISNQSDKNFILW
jgi:hypothetical protein